MADLTIELVRAWLAENKDTEAVGAFLQSLGATGPKLTPETVAEYLKTDEGKRILEPLVDRRVTEAIRTHDAKVKETSEAEVKRRVAEEILKANPQETPEQKQIRELRERIDRQDDEVKRTKRESELKDFAAKEEIDHEIAALMLPAFPSVEEGKLGLQAVKKLVQTRIDRMVNERLAGGFKPGSGNGQQGKGKVDASKLTFQEAVALELEGKLNEAIKPN